jgi:hypothetical protein
MTRMILAETLWTAIRKEQMKMNNAHTDMYGLTDALAVAQEQYFVSRDRVQRMEDAYNRLVNCNSTVEQIAEEMEEMRWIALL